MARLASSEGVWRCVSGGSRGIRSAFVFGGSTWIWPSLACVHVSSDPSILRFSSSTAIAVLVCWFCWALARRLPDCLLHQGLPDSNEGGAMIAARLRPASVFVVVARWFMDLDVIFTSSVFCTTLTVDE